MGKSTSVRQSVSLPAAMAEEIQRIYLNQTGSSHGAMQRVLLRGAELALEELRHGKDGQRQHAPEPPRSCYRVPNMPWHDKLETILVKGSELDVAGIQQSLLWGEGAVLQSTPPAKKKSSGR